MIYPAQLQSQLRTTSPEGEHDQIEHRSKAMVALRDNGTWSLRYRDADNEGQTSLSGTDTWMAISRDGQSCSRLLFRLGEQLEAVYRTPQGHFDMQTRAIHYSAQVDEQGGRVELHYELFVSGNLMAHNRLTVAWKREG